MTLALLLVAVLAGQPDHYPSPAGPLCRVTAEARPGWGRVPGFYDVEFRTLPGCPANGLAWVRVESGRIYDWRAVRPGQPVVFRGVPWWWRASWRSASGRAYAVPVPQLVPPGRETL